VKPLLVIVAVALAAGCGSGSRSLHVHPDGRIGPLKIDVSTEGEIRRFAGKPLKVQREFWPGKKGQFGHSLIYSCGRKCMTSYSINQTTGRLSDYWTNSRRFATERGSRVGMRAARAARLERKRLLPGCGFPRYIHLRVDDDHIFVLAIWNGRVDSIGYLGPHTVYYDGLC
jgi:hypothetical protein